MNGQPTLRLTALIAWPTLWWAIDTTTQRIFPDWSHDSRFYNAYIVPATIASWIHEWTGSWHGQSEWVAIQNGVASVAASVLVAALLLRVGLWRDRPVIRASAALLGVVLPAYQHVLSASTHYSVGLAALFLAYCVAVGSAFMAPLSRDVRLAVLALAFLQGVAFTGWQAATWHWSFVCSLVASLALLGATINRVGHNDRVA